MCMTSPQPLISCTAPGLPKSMNQVVAPAIGAPPAPVPAGPALGTAWDLADHPGLQHLTKLLKVGLL